MNINSKINAETTFPRYPDALFDVEVLRRVFVSMEPMEAESSEFVD